MWSRLHVGDTVAHCFYHPGAFVAQYDRWGHGPYSVHKVEVAVAYAAGGHLHYDFAGLGVVQQHLFDVQRLVGASKHGSFHDLLLAKVG